MVESIASVLDHLQYAKTEGGGPFYHALNINAYHSGLKGGELANLQNFSA